MKNILNRFRKWQFLLCILVVFTVNNAAFAQDTFIDKLIGSWSGNGKLFGSDASFEMKWEWTLDKKFAHLIFQNKVIEAQAFYQLAGPGKYEGTWFDSRGMVLPLKANVEDSALVALWGSPDTERGKTVYKIINEQRLEVSDFVLKKNEWVQFGEAVYGRAADPMRTVFKLQEAFNDHDVEAMVENVTDDLKWLSLVADSVVIETSGRAALKGGMEGYFKAIPSARSEIEAALRSGSFVAVRERAFWKEKNGERSQFALAVYEVRDEKIVRVWYFPAEK